MIILYVLWITSGFGFIFALLECGSIGASSERELYTSRMKEGPISTGERCVGGVICDDMVNKINGDMPLPQYYRFT